MPESNNSYNQLIPLSKIKKPIVTDSVSVISLEIIF